MISLKKSLIALSVLLATSACQTAKPIELKPPSIGTKIPIIPRPRPVRLYDIEFYIVTEATYDEVLEKFKTVNKNDIMYVISVDDYKKLVVNFAEIERYIKQSKRVIVYYEDMIRLNKDVLGR